MQMKSREHSVLFMTQPKSLLVMLDFVYISLTRVGQIMLALYLDISAHYVRSITSSAETADEAHCCTFEIVC